jgi:hypothetical protein
MAESPDKAPLLTMAYPYPSIVQSGTMTVLVILMRLCRVNVGILVLLTVIISFMLFLVQRAEAKRRLFVFVVMLVIGELIRRYVFYRNVHTEAWIALTIALVLNLGFYLFIGRYNPVHSSEEIQVIGLDD